MAKSDLSLSHMIGLEPKQAVEYIKSKGVAFSWDWQDVWGEAHAKSFTVAKAMRADILTDIRGAVEDAIQQGHTFQTFRKELEPKLKAKGWWGRKLVGDGAGAEEVQLGSPWRLRTIYRTNLKTAYAAGRYQAQQDIAKARPYWMRVEVMDSNTRPTHRALHGLVFPHDDPFWNSHYPPDDWGCRGRVRALSERQLKAKGIAVQSSEGRMSQEDVLISTRTGEMRPVSVYTAPDGTKAPTGPGWDYNPGKAWKQPDLDKYDYDIAEQVMAATIGGPLFKRFLDGQGKGNFPVALVDDDLAEAIGAQTRVVQLSVDSFTKNRDHHPEMTAKDYIALPGIVKRAQLVVQDGDRTLVFLNQGEKTYFGAIKSTQTGKSLFLTSFHYARPEEVNRMIKMGKVLRDSRQ